MKLSDHDLRQIDEERIKTLSETAVKSLSITLLTDVTQLHLKKCIITTDIPHPYLNVKLI